jgi:uncharacterized membrane protein
MNQNPLWTLFSLFAVLSLMAVGGANAAIPEMHRVAVDLMHWMSDKQFADMFAISQLSPGPNVIIVALIGYHVAGLAGASVAITAMVVPTCVMAYFVARTWDRFKDARWRIAVQAGHYARDRGDGIFHARQSIMDLRGRRTAGRCPPSLGSRLGQPPPAILSRLDALAGQRLARAKLNFVPVRELDIAVNPRSTGLEHVFGLGRKACWQSVHG